MDIADPATKEIGPCVRKAAHDVRTPLTSIAGFAQLLIEDAALTAGARENAATVLEEAKRLSEMLESFFDEITEMIDRDATDAG